MYRRLNTTPIVAGYTSGHGRFRCGLDWLGVVLRAREAPNEERIYRINISGAMEAPKEREIYCLYFSGAMQAPKERQIHSLGREPQE